MSAIVPPYTTQFLVSAERTITKERLTRYLKATGHDLPRALQLYEHNVALSEALYGLLHGLEVAIRNVVHHTLAAGYRTPAWYDRAPLTPYWKDQVDDAKRRAGAGATPGKIIAELTFGFWVELLSKRNKNHLWIGRGLKNAFPNTNLDRSDIHDRLKTVQLLRNRIAHHEPVLTSNERLYAGHNFITIPELLECVEWVCAATAHWMKTQFRYAEAVRILTDVKAMSISL
jgi:abortive infection bacteriophage resistance protein